MSGAYLVNRYIDSYVAYRILSVLTTSWKDMPAYKLGLIDEKGNILKKLDQLKTQEEKAALSPLHILVFKIKRLFNMVPSEARKIATYATALMLLKEDQSLELSERDYSIIEEVLKQIEEDAVVGSTNTSSSGSVAGLDNNPPVFVKGSKVFNLKPKKFKEIAFPEKKKRKFQVRRIVNTAYLNEEWTDEMIQYISENPDSGIIIRDESLGVMRMLKGPKCL